MNLDLLGIQRVCLDDRGEYVGAIIGHCPSMRRIVQKAKEVVHTQAAREGSFESSGKLLSTLVVRSSPEILSDMRRKV